MANGYYSYQQQQQQQPLPVHLCFFLLVLMMFLGLSWYINYEPILDSIFDQVKMVLTVCPLLFLLLVHWLSNDQRLTALSQLMLPLPAAAHRHSLHRAGSTPWGVAFLLIFLFYMISYQSYFQQRWFPLFARS